MISRECFENKWFYMKYIGKYLSGEIRLARECRLAWGTLYSWGPQATAQRAHVIKRTVSVTVHDGISITLTVTCVRFHIFPRSYMLVTDITVLLASTRIKLCSVHQILLHVDYRQRR